MEPLTFNNLFFLEKLDISFNSLEELPDNTFSQLKNLKSLDLSYNPISIIKKSTLNGLQKLEHFYFAYKQKTLFEKNVFEGLGNLKNLEIKYENFLLPNRIISEEYHTILPGNINNRQADSCFEVDLPLNLEEADLRFQFSYPSLSNWLNSANSLKTLALRLNSNEKINSSYFIKCYRLEELILSHVNLDIDKFPGNLNCLKR